MNTTNLITDYIIAGILGVLTIVFPYILLEHGVFKNFLDTEFKNATFLTIVITAVGYSFGVIFNQFSDYIEEKIYFILSSTVVADAEKDLKATLGFDHHFALQLVVAKSQSAYDYISFRRTMIRIMRSFFSFTFMVPVVHVLYCLLYVLLGYELYFSYKNMIILLFSILLGFFIYYNLKKLYKGYYAALINFALILK